MRVIFLGPPGSGKGTQSRLLCERNNLANVGTGDMLRAAIAQGTDLGVQARPYMDAGQLVPDGFVNALISERLDNPDRPERFVVDGYPRTLPQANALDRILESRHLGLTAVLLLRVPDEELIRRLSGRQRDDDHEEMAKQRLEIFHRMTAPIAAHYRAKGILAEVQGVGEMEQVYKSIMDVLQPSTG